ncbi:MAG: hypothetical protein LBS43_05855 [Prevotellaceae bacterium]|jgi:GR25 family glycosyltransferase involved in LPS biosynthesis|nr:hypothetical protein [Prevotellaceae bacterium]
MGKEKELGIDPEELVPCYFIENIGQVMNKGAIMCTLNHIMFYETMIRKGDNVALIMEDVASVGLLRKFIKNI